MYPGISDFLNDFFGTHFSSSFPPTFGTLVAISFLLAALTLTIELKRKERLGLLSPFLRQVEKGYPASFGEIGGNAIFGFFIGFKIVFIFLHSEIFFHNPQKVILSLQGNLAGGIILGAIFGWMKYREKAKERLAEPVIINEELYPHQIVSEFTMAAAVGGLIGAKIFHLLEYWQDFIADPVGMFFSGSGLTMYGGLIVGGLTVLWYGRRHNVPPLQLCDATAPGLMLAYGVGRLGCQFAGDGDWGIVNTHPKPSLLSWLPDWAWSYNYPHNVISEGIPIPNCAGNHCYMLMEGVFPTPLYESVTCIFLFFVLWSLRKKIMTPGVMFFLYLLFNGIERFLVEAIRVNSKYHVAGISFSQAQLISSLLIITGIAGIIILKQKRKLNPAISSEN